jgi:hypothetical protein
MVATAKRPVARTTATLVVAAALAATSQAGFGARPRFVCEPEAGQRHAGQAEAEFLERLPAGHGLGHVFGQFIEFDSHTFPFGMFVLVD